MTNFVDGSLTLHRRCGTFDDLNEIDQGLNVQLIGEIFRGQRTGSIAGIQDMQLDPSHSWSRNSVVVGAIVHDQGLSPIVFDDLLLSATALRLEKLDSLRLYFHFLGQKGEEKRLMKLIRFDISSKVIEKHVRIDQRRDLIFEDMFRTAVNRSNELGEEDETRFAKDRSSVEIPTVTSSGLRRVMAK